MTKFQDEKSELTESILKKGAHVALEPENIGLAAHVADHAAHLGAIPGVDHQSLENAVEASTFALRDGPNYLMGAAREVATQFERKSEAEIESLAQQPLSAQNQQDNALLAEIEQTDKAKFSALQSNPTSEPQSPVLSSKFFDLPPAGPSNTSQSIDQPQQESIVKTTGITQDREDLDR